MVPALAGPAPPSVATGGRDDLSDSASDSTCFDEVDSGGDEHEDMAQDLVDDLAADFFVHRASHVRHARGTAAGRLACGRAITAEHSPCFADLPVCQKCTAAMMREAATSGPPAKRPRAAGPGAGACSSS